MKEKAKILGTFPDTVFKMATDIIFHRFCVDVESIFCMVFGVKVGKMDTKKHSKNMTAKKSCDGSGPGSCGPLKQFKDPRFKDW